MNDDVISPVTRFVALSWLSWQTVAVISILIVIGGVVFTIMRVADPILNPTYAAGLMCGCNTFAYDAATDSVRCLQVDPAACPSDNPAYPCPAASGAFADVTMQDCIDRCPTGDCLGSKCDPDGDNVCRVSSAACLTSVPM